jgi:hypothetical protein
VTYRQPKIHDHILGRSDKSDPSSDLQQLGYDADLFYSEIILNDDLTMGLLSAMTEPSPQRTLANFAMTWFTIGACIESEKHAQAAASTLPPITNEPA